jgi:hypothetical protein
LPGFVFLPALCGEEEDTMSRKPKVSYFLVMLFWSNLQSFTFASSPIEGPSPSGLPEQAASIAVLVYNHAHLPMETLVQVRDRASLIFRKSGIEIEWLDCPLNDGERSLYPGCPETINRAKLFLRIFPQTAAKTGEAGEAFVAARIANIFWNRVEERAQALKAPVTRLLAHTVAHELGHLLLGSNSHAPAGIMSARWNAQVLTQICQEGLYFNRQQSEVIRSEVRKRERQETVVENDRLIAQR